MSVYFVYRSHRDNPGAFHVKVFPQDTVLEWFRSIWRGIPRTESPPFSSRDHALELVGRQVYSFGSLFEYIHEHGTEAAISRVDTTLAEREAAKDRAQLLNDKGDDANHSHDRIVEIRKTVGS